MTLSPSRFRVAMFVTALLLILLLIAPAAGLAGPTHELVQGFTAMPQNPTTGTLVLASDGYLWGTTDGGVYGCGTIYKVKADGTSWQTVLSFSDDVAPNKGRAPAGGLVSDGAGSLWGTTTLGGVGKFGTIYKVDVLTGVLTTVVEFTGTLPGNKGANPYGELASDGAGYFWGTTQQGGTPTFGTVFKVQASSGVLTTVQEFSSTGTSNRGAYPRAGLVSDGAGAVWGTTFAGGAGHGTVFKVNVGDGALTTVLEFTNGLVANNVHVDGVPTLGVTNKGRKPAAPLMRDAAGNFWGTTSEGGSSSIGTVFKIVPRVLTVPSILTPVVEFSDGGSTLGKTPTAGLLRDASGMLWGTTSAGGEFGGGTFFKLNPTSGSLTTTSFAYSNAPKGATPNARLMSDGAGFLWGTTKGGGGLLAPLGTVFRINASTGELSTVIEFSYNGRSRTPNCGLVADATGALWGTTAGGGASGKGTIFKIDPTSGVSTTMVEFTGMAGSNPGSSPIAGLVSDGAGSFWGTTQTGGAGATQDNGTIFKIDASTGVMTTMVSFTSAGVGNRGANPGAGLVSDGAGFFWGTTIFGGTSGKGTIFKVDANGNLTTLQEFTNGVSTNNVHVNGVLTSNVTNKGSSPYAALVSDGLADRSFWGATNAGGASGEGTIFKVNVGSGALTTVVEFTGTNGGNPYGAMVNDGGILWGTTQTGGASDRGTVFNVNVVGAPVLNTIVEFTGTSGLKPGSSPSAALVKDGTTFWGTTRLGGTPLVGTADAGTVFKVAGGAMTNVVQFSGTGPQAASGNNPGYGPLLKAADGNFYGVTSMGGPSGGGTVFRLRFGPTPLTQPASSIAYTTAVLNALVNPNSDGNTTVNYEYGTSPTFSGATQSGSTVILNAASASSAPIAISGLSPGTTYYFRVRAANAGNSVTQVGATTSFTTVANTLPVVVLVGANPLTVQTAATYTDPGATATDTEDGTLTPVMIANTVSANVVGTYSVTWRATDSAGSAVTATRTVNVVATNLAPAGGALSVSAAANLQQGDSVHLSATGWTDPQTPLTYQFFLGGASLGTAGSSTGIDFSAPAPGTYAVKVRVSDALGAFAEATQSLTVNAGVASWRQTHFGTTSNTAAAADLADPNGNGIANLLEYAWHLDPQATTTNPQVLPKLAESDTHHLQLTFTRYLDCTDITQTVTASDSPAGPWFDIATSVGGGPFVPVPGATVVESGSGASRTVVVTDLYLVTDPLHRKRFLRLSVTR